MERATFRMPVSTKPAANAPRNRRDEVLADCMKFLEWQMGDKRKLGRMLRAMKGKTPSQIYKFMSEARQEGKNPPALFIWKMGMKKQTKKV